MAAFYFYSLGKRISKATPAQLSSERTAVLATADNVAYLLLGSPSPPIMQLSSRRLSMLAWAVAALVKFDVRTMSQPVRQLCYALAQRVCQPGVMSANTAEACRSWAGVLHGLGEAGVKCEDDKRVQQAFRYALEEQLPDLLNTKRKCVSQDVSMIAMACVDAEFKGKMRPFISAVAGRLQEQGTSNVMSGAWPQAWSNLIYACGKLDDRASGQGKALGEGVGVIMREGAAAMAHAADPRALIQPKAQELANTLWGLAHFDWYDDDAVSKLADDAVERVSVSTSQALSNNLWALSTLGWYDCAVYDKLLWGLVKSSKEPYPQDMSNAIYSCAMASHSGAAVDALACMVSKQDLHDWEEQDVANGLYAWAVLSLLGMASADLNGMACTMFKKANSRGTTAFSNSLQTTQLHTAHMEAVRVGLRGGGLSTADGLQQAAAEQHKQGQEELARKAKRSGALSAEKQAMAALQQAGSTVELGARVGDGFAVNLLVQHESCPGGLALNVVRADDLFKHPRGQLSGKVAAVHAQIRQRCDRLVVLSEEEARRPAIVVGAVQRELARVAGQSVEASV